MLFRSAGQPSVPGELVELDWYFELPMGAKKEPVAYFSIRDAVQYIISFTAQPFIIYHSSLLFEATHYTIYRDADEV